MPRASSVEASDRVMLESRLCTRASGTGVWSSAPSASSTEARKRWSASASITPRTRSRMSARSSSSVSNSLTDIANSSSSAGSTRSLTSFSLTWKLTGLPARFSAA